MATPPVVRFTRIMVYAVISCVLVFHFSFVLWYILFVSLHFAYVLCLIILPIYVQLTTTFRLVPYLAYDKKSSTQVAASCLEGKTYIVILEVSCK